MAHRREYMLFCNTGVTRKAEDVVQIQEIDLFNLGVICGVVGSMPSETENCLPRIFDEHRCDCILFCYRGRQDDELIKAILRQRQRKKRLRLILVLNESELIMADLHTQIMTDRIIAQVDMLLHSTWPTEDLPVFVGVHSSCVVIFNAEAERAIWQKIQSLSCENIIKT